MKITIYGTETCRACSLTADYLKTRGIAYDKVDLLTDQEAAQRIREGEVRTLPRVEVVNDDGSMQAWHGFQPPRLRLLTAA